MDWINVMRSLYNPWEAACQNYFGSISLSLEDIDFKRWNLTHRQENRNSISYCPGCFMLMFSYHISLAIIIISEFEVMEKVFLTCGLDTRLQLDGLTLQGHPGCRTTILAKYFRDSWVRITWYMTVLYESMTDESIESAPWCTKSSPPNLINFIEYSKSANELWSFDLMSWRVSLEKPSFRISSRDRKIQRSTSPPAFRDWRVSNAVLTRLGRSLGGISQAQRQIQRTCKFKYLIRQLLKNRTFIIAITV